MQDSLIHRHEAGWGSIHWWGGDICLRRGSSPKYLISEGPCSLNDWHYLEHNRGYQSCQWPGNVLWLDPSGMEINGVHCWGNWLIVETWPKIPKDQLLTYCCHQNSDSKSLYGFALRGYRIWVVASGSLRIASIPEFFVPPSTQWSPCFFSRTFQWVNTFRMQQN